jgi:site-specific DNA-methyltransferase (adenine-specific)
MTQYIPMDAITIGPRQRKKIESQPLADLMESIRQRTGLLHAPTFRKLPDTDPAVWQLIVGERRTRAMQMLHEKNIEFYYNGEVVPKGMLPIVTIKDHLTRADLKQVEYDENKIREPLLWQEDCEALAEIHRLRMEESPGQTRLETANQLIEEKVVETHTSPHALAQRIQRATTIAEHIDNPTIAKARNETEAYNLILKAEEEKINASLARRRLAASSTIPPITIRKGDALVILPQLESNIADLIFSDPPFGIGADSGGFRQRTVHHHNYEDTKENAVAIAQSIILDGFRIAKPMANLWMFCDIDLFFTLREMCGRVGWVPFRTPIVWRKSMSEGMAPWQGKGPRRTYELLLYATKGQRGLISSPVDVLDESRVSRAERIHAAEKPVELLKTIIECSTLPGDFVLDPCCGSGSTLVAARDTKRTGLGIELDETFYNTAMSNVYKDPSAVDDKKGRDLVSLA